MGKQTQFGKYLEGAGLSYEEAADALGITRSYVGMLARGDVTPALELAFKIADWARARGGGEVPADSWEAHVGG